MNKKQVGAFLKVMSKDKARPVLCTALIDEYEGKQRLVATDGYVLCAINIEGADSIIGKMIMREYIERWYKLAGGKDWLTGDILVDIYNEQSEHEKNMTDLNYPKWQSLIPESGRKCEGSVVFNADYMQILQTLDGRSGMKWEFGVGTQPVKCDNDSGIYIFMPMKG